LENLQFTKRRLAASTASFLLVLADFLEFPHGSRCARRPGMTAPTYLAYGQDIRDRAFEFACRIVAYCDDLMKQGGVGRILAPQMLRCGTSIGANLEEARGGESRRDFISKCSIALKEARESLFRLRVADRCQLGPTGRAAALAAEASELAAIIGAIVRNARRNLAL
jgi:four helix bundle protein